MLLHLMQSIGHEQIFVNILKELFKNDLHLLFVIKRKLQCIYRNLLSKPGADVSQDFILHLAHELFLDFALFL